MEALCTCLLQTAAGVHSNTDKVWQLEEDERRSDALTDALQASPRRPMVSSSSVDLSSKRRSPFVCTATELTDTLTGCYTLLASFTVAFMDLLWTFSPL